jgi:cell division protein FtsN
MRRVRSDVSHRIRRQPSIFSVRWFRVALGAGVALILALLVGPSVAGWFGGDMPRSLFLLVPWSAAEKIPPGRPPGLVAQGPASTKPTPPPASGVNRGAAPSSGKTSGVPASGQPVTSGRAAVGGPPAAAAATGAAPAPGPSRTMSGVEAAPAPPETLTAPPAVYWVQVGAFLDHRNADRLAERLRNEGLTAGTTAFEQSRVLYRVLLVGSEGGAVSTDAIERVRGLGHPVETTAEGPTVTGLVPLRRAVEMSHVLRQQGVPVRLKQEVSSSTYRVVRVGSFATVAAAEAALATLTVRGVEGVVVRER